MKSHAENEEKSYFPPVIILFGLCGAGKNFVGEKIAQYFGYHFWDADTVLTDSMKEYIHQKKIFTGKMIEEFVNIVTLHIAELKKEYPHLVIAQAFYRERTRVHLQMVFPEATFFHVQAPSHQIVAQLRKRNNGIDEVYAKSNEDFFEKPRLSHQVIANDGDEARIVTQLSALFKASEKKDEMKARLLKM